jgi:hypothetical protein
MYLRVLPMKGVKRFGVKGKLAPHYIRKFCILEKCGCFKILIKQKNAGAHLSVSGAA